MRDLQVLTDIEFEAVVGDLLSAALDRHVERFSRARDDGVDLRWRTDSDGEGVGQAKHYMRSTFSQLKAAATAEAAALPEIAPDEYRFCTSFDLSKTQKDQIFKIFSAWMEGPHDVLGRRDVDALLDRHPEVERRHPKLWLATGTQLFWATHSDLMSRSHALRERIDRDIARYVINAAFPRAREILNEKKICIIAGVPGIGKTMLAHVLLADAALSGYEPFEISEDVTEGWKAFDDGASQAFFYDDFLGQLSLSERLGKNEDQRLATFIEKVSSSPRKLFILTTREYVLRDARSSYDRLRRLGDKLDFVLRLEDYNELDRAQILYTHLWHGELSEMALSEIAAGGYERIVFHESYSPRLIEYCTGSAFDVQSEGYVDRFVDMMDHPSELWRTAFESHLSREQQMLVVLLVTFARSARVDALRDAYLALCQTLRIDVTAADFRRHLEASEGTFIEIHRSEDEPHARYHNPSVRDFVLDWLGGDPALVATLVDAAVYYEQVERLVIHGVGERRGLPDTSPRRSILDALRSYADATRDRLISLVGSDSPERVEVWTSRVGNEIREPLGYIESRIRFALEVAEEFRPSAAWFREQLQVLIARWSNGLGDKSLAEAVLSQLESAGLDLPEEQITAAHHSLDSWMRTTLQETEEDWLPLMTRIRTSSGSLLEIDNALVIEFEEHARSEIKRWSPEPPTSQELLELANDFGLDELASEIEGVMAEARMEEESRERKADASVVADDAVTGDASVDRAQIAAMFRRLATTPDEVEAKTGDCPTTES